MKNYVGIDLGTTNSAICSYDGDETRIWKSPEQNDVTPSVIYIDRRITFGEDPQAELARIQRLIGDRKDIKASLLEYDDPS